LKQKLEGFQNKLAQTQQEENVDLVNDIKYRAIPNLKEQIDKIEYTITERNKQQQNRLLIDAFGIFLMFLCCSTCSSFSLVLYMFFFSSFLLLK